jgi:signal peptidase I
MLPTIRHNDGILALQRAAKTKLRRGDIVVIKRDGQDPARIIKRIVGLPTENLSITSGRLWVNGLEVQKPRYSFDPTYRFGPIRVPLEHYFVLGDNVKDSEDSRDFGPVPIEDITHKAVAVYWPPQHIKLLV